MRGKNSQTATEYLIILAVVVVIAIVAINTLGGFPGIGANNNKKVSDLKLASDTIGIESYSIGNTSSLFKLRNNYYDTVTVTQFRVNNQTNLTCNSSNTNPSLPIVLNIGQSMIINCTAVNTSTYTLSTKQTPMVGISYTDNMGATRSSGNEGSAVATSNGGEQGGGEEPVVDYSAFTSIVIDSTNDLMWQAGDSSDDPANNGNCYDTSNGCLAWSTDTFFEGETCDSRTPGGDYPACEYCEALALCNNGSFDYTGACSGDLGGVLFNDWRLPSYVDYAIYESDLIGYFKSSNFTSYTNWNYYWTGTSYPSYTDGAYYVGMDDGYIDFDTKDFDNAAITPVASVTNKFSLSGSEVSLCQTPGGCLSRTLVFGRGL